MSRPSEQLWEATPRLHCVFAKKKSFVLNLCTRGVWTLEEFLSTQGKVSSAADTRQ